MKSKSNKLDPQQLKPTTNIVEPGHAWFLTNKLDSSFKKSKMKTAESSRA